MYEIMGKAKKVGKQLEKWLKNKDMNKDVRKTMESQLSFINREVGDDDVIISHIDEYSGAIYIQRDDDRFEML